MMILSCRKLKKSYGDIDVLADINLDIEAGEKLGIVGRNGAGKTTLLDIILGRTALDSGTIKFYKDRMKTAYLLQSADYEVANYDGGFLTEERENEYGQMEDESFLKTTSVTGLEKVKLWSEGQMSNLSGGERTKIALSQIWTSKPDLLILDEPTNHMDVKGIEWLISEVEKYNGTCIIVSHDRYFLDKTVKHIVEIEDGKINDYSGNYTFYREEKARRHEIQLNKYILQEKYKGRIEEQIETLKEWSTKAHRDSTRKEGFKEYYRKKAKKKDIQIKSRLKRLKKIEVEGIEKPKEEMKVDFGFEEVQKGGKRLLEAKELTKSFEGKVVFKRSSFYIGRGEKIGIIGPNGCGKTTLLKLILKEDTPDSGELWISDSAKTVYLSQENREADSGLTLGRMLEELYPERWDRVKVRNLLVSMGIGEASINMPFNDLSYGERVRVRIANMIMKDNDLLVLDEPTNHLDLYSREKLEEAILDYRGTVLFVSHDRYALQRVCDKLLIFEDKKIIRYEGNYEEYTERVKRLENQRKMERRSENGLKSGKKLDKNERMLLELKIARVLGKLSTLKQEDEEYGKLDIEYRKLIEEKNMSFSNECH